MTKPDNDYPIFQVDEVVASRGPEYKRIIPKISPRYFFSNPRFRSLGQVSFPNLIDYMGIYEEGDRWTLTIIDAVINNTTQYLFLPLTESIPPDFGESEHGRPAFGIETNSQLYGKRIWQAFDAFDDELFYQKLCNLFLPYEGVPENHVNAYVNIQKSGVGTFKFHVKHELKDPIHLAGTKMEITESGLWLRFAKYNLRIYQLLPAMVDVEPLEESPDVAGWIVYTGEKGLRLLVAVLYDIG
jgi:hypothetical protein